MPLAAWVCFRSLSLPEAEGRGVPSGVSTLPLRDSGAALSTITPGRRPLGVEALAGSNSLRLNLSSLRNGPV